MEQVAAPTLRKRDPWLDNAKGLLMILVVTGHLLAPITNYSRMAKWLYYLINSFHMPMFLMISGFLSRRRILQKDNVGIINKLVTPYLLAQILLYVLACFIPGGVYEIGADYDRMSFLKPIYALWYIFAMILYNLVCVQWQPQKRPVLSLAVVMAMSLGIGCFRMIDFMYLSKIIGFFPYFMMASWRAARWWSGSGSPRPGRLPPARSFLPAGACSSISGVSGITGSSTARCS